MVASICNPSIRETQAGGSRPVPGQPGLNSKFKASLNCIHTKTLSQKRMNESKTGIRKTLKGTHLGKKANCPVTDRIIYVENPEESMKHL